MISLESAVKKESIFDEGELPLLEKLDHAIRDMNQILLGKSEQIQLAVCCVLAGGHLLIEDLPGVGKTTLARLLAHVLGLGSQRVQFTSDLLPSDILGVSIYDEANKRFKFVAGPVFTQILIADEINRTTPKTQSALLEAMAEYQVTIEGTRRDLPKPFFVVATQNPEDQIGTYPLPESQLDRFLIRLSMGYPNAESEKALLQGSNELEEKMQKLHRWLTREEIVMLQDKVKKIHVQPAIIDYLQKLLENSREQSVFRCGISPRGGIALLQAAKAWALLHGRMHVVPQDIQSLIYFVWGHRLQSKNGEHSQQSLVHHLIKSVQVV